MWFQMIYQSVNPRMIIQKIKKIFNIIQKKGVTSPVCYPHYKILWLSLKNDISLKINKNVYLIYHIILNIINLIITLYCFYQNNCFLSNNSFFRLQLEILEIESDG